MRNKVLWRGIIIYGLYNIYRGKIDDQWYTEILSEGVLSFYERHLLDRDQLISVKDYMYGCHKLEKENIFWF